MIVRSVKPKLYLIRGCSGSGKTTLAKEIALLYRGIYDEDQISFVETDQFFYNEKGEYEFVDSKLNLYHRCCYETVRSSMTGNVPVIILSNTNCRNKDLKEYVALAEVYSYDVISLVVEHRHHGVNGHGVDRELLLKQANQLRGSLKLTNVEKEKQ